MGYNIISTMTSQAVTTTMSKEQYDNRAFIPFHKNVDGSYTKKPPSSAVPYKDGLHYFCHTKNMIPRVQELVQLPDKAFDKVITDFPPELIGDSTDRGIYVKEGLLSTGVKIYQLRFDTGVICRVACLEWLPRWNAVLFHKNTVEGIITTTMLDISNFLGDKGIVLRDMIPKIRKSLPMTARDNKPIVIRLEPCETFDSNDHHHMLAAIHNTRGGFDHSPFRASPGYYWCMWKEILKDSDTFISPKVVCYQNETFGKMTWAQVSWLVNFLVYCKPEKLLNSDWGKEDNNGDFAHIPQLKDDNVDYADRRVPDLLTAGNRKEYEYCYCFM